MKYHVKSLLLMGTLLAVTPSFAFMNSGIIGSCSDTSKAARETNSHVKRVINNQNLRSEPGDFDIANLDNMFKRLCSSNQQESIAITTQEKASAPKLRGVLEKSPLFLKLLPTLEKHVYSYSFARVKYGNNGPQIHLKYTKIK